MHSIHSNKFQVFFCCWIYIFLELWAGLLADTKDQIILTSELASITCSLLANCSRNFTRGMICWHMDKNMNMRAECQSISEQE